MESGNKEKEKHYSKTVFWNRFYVFQFTVATL
jgi:hypothetical protein